MGEGIGDQPLGVLGAVRARGSPAEVPWGVGSLNPWSGGEGTPWEGLPRRKTLVPSRLRKTS